jgi:hypothetical protein
MFLELFKLFFKNILPLSEEEYNVKSQKFNPLKVMTVVILVASLVFNILLVINLTKLYSKIEALCPVLLPHLK